MSSVTIASIIIESTNRIGGVEELKRWVIDTVTSQHDLYLPNDFNFSDDTFSEVASSKGSLYVIGGFFNYATLETMENLAELISEKFGVLVHVWGADENQILDEHYTSRTFDKGAEL